MLRRGSSKRQVIECQFAILTHAMWTQWFRIILTLVFYKMVKLNKYVKILICRNRSNGSSIKEHCDNYGQDRETILRIRQKNLVLPVDNGLAPTTEKTKKKVLKKVNG